MANKVGSLRSVNREGQIHTSKQGYSIKIIKYTNSNDCDIQFIDLGYKLYGRTYREVIKGSIKNPFHPCIYNFGFIGVGKYKSSVKSKKTKQYQTWFDMLKRGYCKKYLKKYPSYNNTVICKEWHNFQNFAQWFDNNYIANWHLDKDILFEGNKTYSPKNCCFVPQELNKLFMTFTKNRDFLPVAVYKRGEKFLLQLRNKYIQLFDNKEDAIAFYNNDKALKIEKILETNKLLFKDYVYNHLFNLKTALILNETENHAE